MADQEQEAETSAARSLLLPVFTALAIAIVVFSPVGLLNRIDQSEEGKGFISQQHEFHADRTWRARREHGVSLWRDVDGDRVPDVHEWRDDAGSWVQDTRDYKGGRPSRIGE